MNTLSDLDQLDHLEGYRNLFTNVAFWTPYVQAVCRRHGLACADIRTGVPGTCPVFIAGPAAAPAVIAVPAAIAAPAATAAPGAQPGAGRWVVKFFGRLFEGARAFAAEREAGRLCELDPEIHTARVVAVGELLDGMEPGETGWPWPYLIFETIPGASFGEAAGAISLEDRLRAARELGETVWRIHALPLEGSPVFPNTLEPYLRFLERQREGVAERQRGWGSLPRRLVEEIDDFIPPLVELVDRSHPPHLIHADLTRDHLLGRFENGRWASLGLIDFGDAMTGDLLYELAALHLDCFGSDRRLLLAFLEAYGLSAGERALLPRRALATALLHQFNVFAAVPPERLRVGSLGELADQLWGLS
jgi:hypothetical protein